MANFDLGAWLTENLIAGVANGTFYREYVAMLAANYLLKGLLTEAQVQAIAEGTAEPAASEITDNAEVMPTDGTEAQ